MGQKHYTLLVLRLTLMLDGPQGASGCVAFQQAGSSTETASKRELEWSVAHQNSFQRGLSSTLCTITMAGLPEPRTHEEHFQKDNG